MLNWPIEESAVCEALMPVWKTLGAVLIGTYWVELKPNFPASCAIRASPTS